MPITYREIEDDDLLTWEMQFRREGTLPADVQRLLLENALDRPVNTERTKP